MSLRETFVAWSDEYALDLPEIDDQHKVLFEILNSLWAAIVNRAKHEEMVDIINRLEQYTVSHFTAEEVYMRAIGYADFDAHRETHKAFVTRLADEKRLVESGGAPGLDLLKFLRDWLANHILVADKAYARANQEPKSILGRFFKKLTG